MLDPQDNWHRHLPYSHAARMARINLFRAQLPNYTKHVLHHNFETSSVCSSAACQDMQQPCVSFLPEERLRSKRDGGKKREGTKQRRMKRGERAKIWRKLRRKTKERWGSKLRDYLETDPSAADGYNMKTVFSGCDKYSLRLYLRDNSSQIAWGSQ